MARHTGSRDFASVQSLFAPLVALLERELARARVAVPLRNPRNLGEFTRWYLEVVQLLERQVARESGREPMARDAVELMCRCAMSARDLRGAIDLCARYSVTLYPRAGQLFLAGDGDTASLQLDSLRPQTTPASSLVDITGLFAFRQLLQWLAGRELPLRRVSIGPIQRDDVLPFLKLFRAPVLAGGDLYSLDFDAAALDWPCVRGRAEFEHFFALFPCAVFGIRASGVGGQVSALMMASLEQGEGVPGQARLAEILEIPLSTLRRRLREAGTGYRELREQCLSEMAAALLARSELSVGQVALRLGFGDAGAFRRAFHQWYGCAPGTWQAAQR